MSTEQMRQEFEAWASEHEFLGGCHFNRKPSGNYHDVDFQHAWESWQASRAAVVVHLPVPGYEVPDRHHTGQCEYRDRALLAIEAAGLKVEP